MTELIELIKEYAGISSFRHLTVSEKDFEAWVSEVDSINSYIVVDKGGNIAVYEKDTDSIDKIYMNVATFEDFKKDYAPVRMMIMIERYPEMVEDKQIRNGRQLLGWIKENDSPIYLDPVEAKAVMDTYMKTGYALYQDDGSLYMKKGNKAVKICIDDVIDLAGEKSYEAISQIKQELEVIAKDKSKRSSVDDFAEHLDKFTELLRHELTDKSIISAYSKTTYGKRYYYDYLYSLPALKLKAEKKHAR